MANDEYREPQQAHGKWRILAGELWTYTHFLIGGILVSGYDESDWQVVWWLMGAWWLHRGVQRVIREVRRGE